MSTVMKRTEGWPRQSRRATAAAAHVEVGFVARGEQVVVVIEVALAVGDHLFRVHPAAVARAAVQVHVEAVVRELVAHCVAQATHAGRSKGACEAKKMVNRLLSWR